MFQPSMVSLCHVKDFVEDEEKPQLLDLVEDEEIRKPYLWMPRQKQPLHFKSP